MPELPEVEHARRSLESWLRGRRVERAEAEQTRIFRGQGPRLFERALSGRRLERADRRGKCLLLFFDGGQGLFSHLGMTGKYVRRPPGQQEPYSRARFVLDDGFVVHYRDPRMFGRMAVHPAAELLDLPEIHELGPDPLLDGVSVKVLAARFSRTARPIKLALMDQALVAGLGNVQAAEALFRARIDPRRKADSLGAEEIARLAKAIRDSIAFTLKDESGPEIAYVEEAGAQNPFLVYGKAGQPCPRCKQVLRSFPQGGRTTHYCPNCQR